MLKSSHKVLVAYLAYVGAVILFWISIFLLVSCNGNPISTQSSNQRLSTTVEAQDAKVSTDTISTQDTSQASGNSLRAKTVEVDTISTENNTGINFWYFLAGGIILGIIIPQPRILKMWW